MYDTKASATPIKFLARIIVATAALVTVTGSASADPISPAGWTAGLALGAPLPEGVYFINTATYFERSASAPGAPTIDAGVNLPLIAWSTPYTILGGRLELIATVPQIAVGINPGAPVGSSWHRDFYNPAGLMVWPGILAVAGVLPITLADSSPSTPM
jgi:hypothetical protein